MNRSWFWLSILAVALSFAGGFFLANALNRNNLDQLRNENERLRTAAQNNSSGNLADADREIQEKIKEAETNPNDHQLQRGLGMALYRYGSMKQDIGLLNQTVVILERALAIKPDERDVRIALANTHFDLDYFGKTGKDYQKAETVYRSILKDTPDDVEVRTDLGLTLFLRQPSETDAAIREFQTALQKDPKHQKALQFMVRAKWQSGNTQEAAKYLDKLKTIDPGSQVISELSTLLTRPPTNQ
ncbi:MAG: tetratricopeptide repeat protein [Acidobacteria bacterium]|nr:tetratricopeptide repeat protein [Acidobacteriota bacterium]